MSNVVRVRRDQSRSGDADPRYAPALATVGSSEQNMRRTKTVTLALIIAVALLLFGGLLAAAFAEDWLDVGAGDTQPATTTLSLRAKQQHVVVGRTVALMGRLTAEATETVEGDGADTATDDGTADGDWTTGDEPLETETEWTDPGVVSAASVDAGDDIAPSEAKEIPVAGAVIAIYRCLDGEETWSRIATVTTGGDGSFVATQAIAVDTAFRAEYAGDESYDAAESDSVEIEACSLVSSPVPTGRGVVGNRTFLVRGKATSGAGTVTISAYKRGRAGRLAKALAVRASVRNGSYAARLKLPPGSYEIAAAQSGTPSIRGSASKRRQLRVARPSR
jgi:hypothetical protein